MCTKEVGVLQPRGSERSMEVLDFDKNRWIVERFERIDYQNLMFSHRWMLKTNQELLEGRSQDWNIAHKNDGTYRNFYFNLGVGVQLNKAVDKTI